MSQIERDAEFSGEARARGVMTGAPPAIAAIAALPPRRGEYPRLRLHQRFLPLLIALAAVCTLSMAGLAYVGARVNAIGDAGQRELRNASVARQLIADQGPNLVIADGHLVVGVDSASLTLNNDTAIVDRARGLDNAYTTIYQIEGANLVAISTNLPTSDGHGHAAGATRALGDALSGPAYDSLLGQCGSSDTQACHQPYSGVVPIRGIDYIAGFQPMFDSSGAFVGALGSATPLETVTAPAVQLAVLLLLVGLLAALLCIMVGVWFFNAFTLGTLHALDARLDGVATAATTLDGVARAQIERAGRQNGAARRVHEHMRTLDALSTSLDQGHAELRETASEIWAGMSQPGMEHAPERALELARQSAVVSARVGTTAAHLRDLCRQLGTLMGTVVSESNAVTDSGRELQLCAHELGESINGVAATLGEPVGPRSPSGGMGERRSRSSGSLWAAWISRFRRAFGAGDARSQRPSRPSSGIYRTGGTGRFPIQQPARTGDTGWMSAVSGMRPRNTGSYPIAPSGARPGMTRTGRHPGIRSGATGATGATGAQRTMPPRATGAPRLTGQTGHGSASASGGNPPRTTKRPSQTGAAWPAAQTGRGNTGQMPLIQRGQRSHPGQTGPTGQMPVAGRGQTGEWKAQRRTGNPASASSSSARSRPPAGTDDLGLSGLPGLPSDDAPWLPRDLDDPRW